jgi:hypothetical protein
MVKRCSPSCIVLGAIMQWPYFRYVCWRRRTSMPPTYYKSCMGICFSVVILLTWAIHSAELEITVPLLVQIDKLVQLIESPVFTCKHSLKTDALAHNIPLDLRLQLLEPDKYPHLYKCLYGLLMLLPQSPAFISLRNRLNAVSTLGFLHIAPKP